MARSPIELTARQREILTLARAGHSNSEIADILSVSVRTVEGHIYRATRRYGIDGRDALVEASFGRV
jgi:DNA-binding CsgD family transcriptional regulator